MDAVILLPTLNEERGLPLTLDDLPLPEVRSRGWSVFPLVIDGGSKDATRAIASIRGVPVVAQRGRGKGGAIREGLELLRRIGVRYAVVLDADATYPGPAILPALELLDSGNDLVVGVRQSNLGHLGGVRDLIHRVGNVMINFAAGQYSRSRYLDLTSGFWAVNVERAAQLELATNDFGIEAELFLKAHTNGWTTAQIPIEYRERVGEAKLHAVPDGARILLTILRYGHRSLQATSLPISQAPGVLRELLLTAFIEGYQHVEVRCSPATQEEAQRVAGRLRRTGLQPQVVVEDSPAGMWTPTSGTAPAPGVVMRFGPRGGLLCVELADASPVPPPLGAADKFGGTSRSGAFMKSRSQDRADFLDPLRSVGEQLNTDPAARRRQLMTANGIRFREVPESEPTGFTDLPFRSEQRAT